jgi:hypothetical protein
MRILTYVRFALCVLILLGAAPRSASGWQVSAGVQGVWGSQTDLGIGGRVILDMGSVIDRLDVVGSFDWYFPGNEFGIDVEYWEANANLVYRLGRGPSMVPYAGAGAHLTGFSAATDVLGTPVSGSDHQSGGNLLAGLLLHVRGLRPFVEGRLELGGGDQFVLAAGIRF